MNIKIIDIQQNLKELVLNEGYNKHYVIFLDGNKLHIHINKKTKDFEFMRQKLMFLIIGFSTGLKISGYKVSIQNQRETETQLINTYLISERV